MIKAPPAPIEKLVVRKNHEPSVVIPVVEQTRPEMRFSGISFYHSGDLGDAIFSLPVIRAMGGGTLVLGPNIDRSPFRTRERMTQARADLLIPLLKLQPYITDAVFSPRQPVVNYDLNQFRRLFDKSGPHENLAHAHLKYFGLGVQECDRPWLVVDHPVRVEGKPVVVSKTLRYPGKLDWHRVVSEYGDQIVFIGMQDEHVEFCRKYGDVPHYPTVNLLEAARVIAGSELFISNQGGLHAVAEGLKVKLIQEPHPASSTAMFIRPGAAYDLPDKLFFVEQRKCLFIEFSSPVDGFSGIGQSAAQFMFGLSKRGHDVTCNPTRESEMFGLPDKRLKALRGSAKPGTMRVVMETTGQLRRTVKLGDVVITLWETDVWPAEDVAALNLASLVLVTCRWNADSLKACGCVAPIKTIPLGVDTDLFMEMSTYPTICTFGAAGRVAGAGGRKGIDLVVEAFLKAFPRQQDVRLRLKVFSDCPVTDKANDSRIEVNRDYMTPKQIAAWHRGNTAFFSASFGEGWGLCLHEAMASGCCPVAMCYGGHAEFFDASMGHELSFCTVPAHGGSTFEGLGNWAIPDYGEIPRAMQRVYFHQDEAALLGSFAAQRAREFSWDHAVECLEKELLAL